MLINKKIIRHKDRSIEIVRETSSCHYNRHFMKQWVKEFNEEIRKNFNNEYGYRSERKI